MDLLIASWCPITRCWKVLSESADAWLVGQPFCYPGLSAPTNVGKSGRHTSILWSSYMCSTLCVLCPLFLNLICIYVICVILCVHTVLPSPKTWSAQCLRKIIHSWSVWIIQFAEPHQVLASPRLFGKDLLHWWWRHRVWQRGKCKANGAWICASRHGRSLG